MEVHLESKEPFDIEQLKPSIEAEMRQLSVSSVASGYRAALETIRKKINAGITYKELKAYINKELDIVDKYQSQSETVNEAADE